MASADERGELLANVLQNPDDSGACQVYGDWLADHGDPRGELCQIQIRLAAASAGDVTPTLVMDDAEGGGQMRVPMASMHEEDHHRFFVVTLADASRVSTASPTLRHRGSAPSRRAA